MDLVSSDVLEDDRYRVPPVPAGTRGMPWLRDHVARFSEGDAHARRRSLIDALLRGLVVDPAPSDDPTAVLLRCPDLPVRCVADIALIAESYQPHLPQFPAADAAVERLVALCGSRDEMTAARICVLVQAHGATRALIAGLRSGSTAPPVLSTRRLGPGDSTVEVDLSDAPFGRGRHACPGRTIALDLARAAVR